MTERRPTFHGEGAELFRVFIVGALLTILTLGVYSFWMRTNIRRWLWGSIGFEGDRLTYHGTGGELFKGWLMAAGLFLVLGIANFVLSLTGNTGTLLSGLLFYAVVLVLIPVAIIGSRRYRLRRTSWRGIRFAQFGNAWDFAKVWISGVLLTGVTLSLYRPWFEMKTRGFLWNETKFGTARFAFDGEGSDLFGPYVKALLLTIPTLGLIWFWYWAQRTRYVWEHTSLEGARFASTVTGGGLLGLTLTNMLLVMCTLGLGTPWAIVRQVRYNIDHFSLVGDLDFAAVIQASGPTATAGEGLADVLDVGGFDIGL